MEAVSKNHDGDAAGNAEQRRTNYQDRRDLQLAEERSYLERLGDPTEKDCRRSKFDDRLDTSTFGLVCDRILQHRSGDKFDRQGILKPALRATNPV